MKPLTEKIEEIREKCIEANPSIKDLTHECVIKVKSTYPVFGRFIQYVGMTGGEKIQLKLEGHIRLDSFSEDVCEIIGRPIRLADVLLTIDEVGERILIESDSTIHRHREGETGYAWNLKQDELTLQSEETIDFLHNLLFGNQ